MFEQEESICEEVCSSHKQVLWSIDYDELKEGKIMRSPFFEIDNQGYLLTLQISEKSIEFKLFRMGPSIDRSVLWWAGLKRSNGSYHHVIENGSLHLEKECKLWTEMKNLGSFNSEEVEKSHFTIDDCITFFFRMNVERAQIGEKMCTHDVAEMRVWGEGSIREEMCPSHKSVLWNIGLGSVQEGSRKICSPSFIIGKQSYLLELKRSQRGTEFNLFRMGPSAKDLVLWWAGLKLDSTQERKEGKFSLQQECELWTAVKNLGSFSAADFLEADRSKDNRIIFFLMMKLKRAGPRSMKCNHSIDSMLFAPPTDTKRGEVLISNESTEWRVPRLNELLTSKEPFKFTSQEFVMGSQRYILELSSPESSKWVNIILYNKGLSFAKTSRFIRWWIKLVRSDGTFDRVKGELDLEEECDIWTQRNLHRTTRCAIYSTQKPYGYPFHICTIDEKTDCVFVIFSTKSTPDAVEIPEGGDGTIIEVKCDSHAHVEWEVDNGVQQKDFTSPEFVIGTQSYKLKFTFMSDGLKNEIPVNLDLISRGPYIANSSQSIRWCVGLMSSYRSSCFDNGFGRLDLKEECGVWTQKLLRSDLDLASDLEHSVEKFSIFFFMDKEIEFIESTKCAYNNKTKYEWINRFIKEDLCSHHQHREWLPNELPDLLEKINYSILSPVFHIGAQTFLLQLRSDDFALIEFSLYTLGPSGHPSQPVRWWAGFKRADGTYLSSSSSGILDPSDQCGILTHRGLLSVHKDEIQPEVLSPNKFPTVFFRINVEQAETKAEECVHSAIETLPTQSKTIKKVESIQEKQIEYVLHAPARMDGNWWTSRSREFAVGTQRFYFQLSCTLHPGCPLLILRLYSRGPAHTGRPPYARWLAGLKRNNGEYYHRNLSGKLDLKEACTLWTLRGTQFFVHYKCEETDLLSLLGQLHTVFFRLSEEEQASSVATEYIPGIVELSPTCDFGEIEIQEYDFYTQVKWTALYEPLEGKFWNIVSPEFTIGTQRYILELSQDLNAVNSIILCLYRWGPSVTCPSGLVQWWAGLKRGNGTCHYKNKRGELDLKENCDLWTQIYLHRVCRYRLERELLTPDDDVTVFFRLSKEQVAPAFTHSSDVPQREFKRQRREDDSGVIFKVQEQEFVVSGTIFSQFPVFEAMFCHDTTEKRTGVVSIKDIEPDVFKDFLHYVSTGFVQKLTADNVHALYIVADKYLVDELKALCLQYMSDILSVDNFFDVLTVALRCGEDDLMEEAISFLSRNKDITRTDTWEKFYSDNEEAANELVMRAFLPL